MARRSLTDNPVVIAHVLIESFSVLTRLPQPRRLAPALVLTALRSCFPSDPVALDANVVQSLLDRLVLHGVVGGRVYDALIAETARQHRLELVTVDRRAATTYEVVGADFAMLA